MATTTTWNKASVQELLDKSDAAVKRALLVIYARQTTAEQAMEQTVLHNNRGFSSCDAEILSSFAKQFQRKQWLSPKQIAFARKRLKRYWRQLLEEIGEKQAAQAPAKVPPAPVVDAPVAIETLPPADAAPAFGQMW